MSVFHYRAINDDGQNTEGTIEATNEAAAVQLLTMQNYAVYEIKLGSAAVPEAWYNRQLFQGGFLKPTEIAEFSSGLSALLLRHIQLDESLLIVSETASTPRVRHVAVRLRGKLLTGASTEDAFAEQSSVFPAVFLAMVRAGARSNTLGDALTASARYFDQQSKAKQKLFAAMAYPVFLMVAAICVFLVILFTMVPALYATIVGAGQGPSGSIAMLYAVSIYLQAHWVLVAEISIALLCVIIFYRKPLGSRLRSVIPAWRRASEQAYFARVSRILHAQLMASQTIDQALSDTVDILGGSEMVEPLGLALSSLRTGDVAGPVFLASERVPELFGRLYDLGERTDNLTDLLLHTANSLDESYTRVLNRLTGLLTPFLTLFVGAIIALLVQVLISAVLEVSQVAI